MPGIPSVAERYAWAWDRGRDGSFGWDLFISTDDAAGRVQIRWSPFFCVGVGEE